MRVAEKSTRSPPRCNVARRAGLPGRSMRAAFRATRADDGRVDMATATAKVVLVTGASSGIGRACAEHLVTRGWQVFGAQRRVPAEGAGPAGVAMLAMDVDDDASEIGRAHV